MIIDKIENAKLYSGINSKIAQAFNFINKTDLLQIPSGKHKIDNEEVFAIVMEYDTKAKSESKFEGHHKYIDLQYIISGSEAIGITTLTNQVPIETNKDDDYELYDLDADLIKFSAGIFMIFFPDDLHMPGVHLNGVSKVRKVVVKIKV